MAEYVDSLGEVMDCNTEPNYDSILPFDDYWLCGDWITYHKLLLNECGYSADQALLIVEQKLRDRAIFGHEWFCQFEDEFREYFESQGADFGFLSNTTNSVLETTEGIGSGLASVGKTLRILLPIAIIGAGVYFGFKAYKEFKK
tara:strand:- start:689 stop:1120 length:432 start_codon:yes stop_codon:yes gene_type:complete